MAIRFQTLGEWVFDIRETFLKGYNQFYLGKSNFILTNTSEDYTIYYKVYFQNLSDTNLIVPESSSPISGSVTPGSASSRSFDVKYNSTTDPTGTNHSYTISGEMVIEAYSDSGYTSLIDSITHQVQWKIINPNNMTLIKSWDFENLDTTGLTNDGWSEWNVITTNEAYSGLHVLREMFHHGDYGIIKTHDIKTTLSFDLSGYTEAYLIFSIRKTFESTSFASILSLNDYVTTNRMISLGNMITADSKWRKFVVPLDVSLTQASIGFRAVVKYIGWQDGAGFWHNGTIDIVYELDYIQIYGV